MGDSGPALKTDLQKMYRAAQKIDDIADLVSDARSAFNRADDGLSQAFLSDPLWAADQVYQKWMAVRDQLDELMKTTETNLSATAGGVKSAALAYAETDGYTSGRISEIKVGPVDYVHSPTDEPKPGVRRG